MNESIPDRAARIAYEQNIELRQAYRIALHSSRVEKAVARKIARKDAA